MGLTATSYTAPLWPMNFYGLEFGLNPHVIIILSVDDEINCFKFGLNITYVILSLWPLKDLISYGAKSDVSECRYSESDYFVVIFWFLYLQYLNFKSISNFYTLLLND